jgi:predicted DNA-binding protein YlxM (UPF0122 family)
MGAEDETSLLLLFSFHEKLIQKKQDKVMEDFVSFQFRMM